MMGRKSPILAKILKKDVDYRWEDPQSKSEKTRIKSSAAKHSEIHRELGNNGALLGEKISHFNKVADLLNSLSLIEEKVVIGIASFAAEIHQIASDLVEQEITRYLTFEYAVIPKLANDL